MPRSFYIFSGWSLLIMSVVLAFKREWRNAAEFATVGGFFLYAAYGR